MSENTAQIGVNLAEIEMKLQPLLSNPSPLIRQLAWVQLKRIQAIHKENMAIIEAYANEQEKTNH